MTAEPTLRHVSASRRRPNSNDGTGSDMNSAIAPSTAPSTRLACTLAALVCFGSAGCASSPGSGPGGTTTNGVTGPSQSGSRSAGDGGAQGGSGSSSVGSNAGDAAPTASADGGSNFPPVAGAELFVSTTGSDSNPGTEDAPLKTLGAAQAKVRANPERGTVPIWVTVLPGTYYIGQTIVFTSEDSGTQAAPVEYRGGGNATLSGGVSLGGLTWTASKNGIMQAAVPPETFANYSFDDGKAARGVNGSAPGSSGSTYGFSSVLFLNGQRQHMARYPNYTNPGQVFGGSAGDAQSRPGNWTHGPSASQPAYLHGVHGSLWGSEDYVVTDKSNTTQHGPLCNGRPQGLNNQQFVENGFDELDAPGEWYYDRAGLVGPANTLYFYPPSGVDLTKSGSYSLEMAALERVFEFDGGCGSGAARPLDDGGVGLPSYPKASTCASTPPVQWLTLDGFHYTDTLRTFSSCNEQILRSDWQIYRGGSVFVTGAEHVTISNSFFDQVGGAGVFVNGYNDSVSVTGNLFIDTGSSAILFMGSNNAVRNPLFGYGAGTVPVNQLDRTPGPQTNDYPSHCSATENLIHDIGDPELQVAGVAIDMAADITVSHNSIYNMPRAGINVGDGCWGGHTISYNDVFATVLFTGDHGAYNSWGRDRYWDSSTGSIESRVGTPPNGLQVLDAVKPITLAHNRWRCDQGWDVDLDDGSTNYIFTDNIFLSGGLKWREGYDRDGENNVFVQQNTTPCAPNAPTSDVSGCLSVHVWPTGSSDVFIHKILGPRARQPRRVRQRDRLQSVSEHVGALDRPGNLPHGYALGIGQSSVHRSDPRRLPTRSDLPGRRARHREPAIAHHRTVRRDCAPIAGAGGDPAVRQRGLEARHYRRGGTRLHGDDALARCHRREPLSGRAVARGPRLPRGRFHACRPGGEPGGRRRLRQE